MKQIINRMELRFPSGSVNESFARGAVSAFVLCLDPLVTDLNDLKTAVSEAVTNAIVHGYRDTIGTVYITAVIYADGTVQVKLSDGIVSDAAAGGDYIKLNSHARFSELDLQVLEVHEGWVHVGTTLNGQNLLTYPSYRQTSTALSSVNLPADTFWSGLNTGAHDFVTDGYWVALEPLDRGSYTLAFGGESVWGALEVVDVLRVPEPSSLLLTLCALAPLAAQWRRRAREAGA